MWGEVSQKATFSSHRVLERATTAWEKLKNKISYRMHALWIVKKKNVDVRNSFIGTMYNCQCKCLLLHYICCMLQYFFLFFYLVFVNIFCKVRFVHSLWELWLMWLYWWKRNIWGKHSYGSYVSSGHVVHLEWSEAQHKKYQPILLRPPLLPSPQKNKTPKFESSSLWDWCHT